MRGCVWYGAVVDQFLYNASNQRIYRGNGLVYTDSELSSGTPGYSTAVQVRKRLWSIGNYSRFIRPGYVRIGATATPTPGVNVSAYKDPATQRFVMVAINANSASSTINVSIPSAPIEAVVPFETSASRNLQRLASTIPVINGAFSYTLPGNSITTLIDADGPSVASWAPNRLDIFACGTDNALWHRYSADGGTNWAAWESLGTPPGVQLASSPGAVSWSMGTGSNRLDVFVRGTDNALWHRWYDGPATGWTWSGWQPLGGNILSAPSAASWAPGRIDVFARGANGTLQHLFTGDSGNSWSVWESLGGNFVGAPAAVSWSWGNGSNRLDVYVRKTDNTLGQIYYDGPATGWTWSGWTSPLPSTTLASSPTVTSWGPGRLDVFARGTDTSLIHQYFATTWSAWESLGGGLGSAPGATSWGSNRNDIFVRGMDSATYQRPFNGAWQPYRYQGGYP